MIPRRKRPHIQIASHSPPTSAANFPAQIIQFAKLQLFYNQYSKTHLFFHLATKKIKKIDTCNYFANADTNKLIYNLLRIA